MNEQTIAVLKVLGKAAVTVVLTAAASVFQDSLNTDSKGIFSKLIRK